MTRKILGIGNAIVDVFSYVEDDFLKNYEHISNQLNDYHVLAMMDNFVESVTFECFNAPYTEIEFEELKHHVLELLK